MQSTSIPTKYLVPFAQNDSAKVSIPVTTTDATRASQSLGFPPLTGQPPEAGGVPPQLEDFNGALNQIAAVAWWMMAGGSFPFDSTFAAATQIAGYPLGAKVPSVDAKGAWISTVEANTVNPDTDTVLTSWVPGHQYGITAISGLTGGTVTLTGAQASKKAITLAGVLTSNLILVMPTWTYDWRITNSTTGAFTVTVKTSAGSGVACANGGIVTPVIGDGTNIVLQTQTLLVAAATAPGQPLPLSQATGRLLNVRKFTTIGTATYTPTTGTTAVRVTVVGGGGSGAGAAATASGQCSIGSGGGAGAIAQSYLTSGFSGIVVTVGAGGAGAAGFASNGGGTSSFGSLLTAPGGAGGQSAGPATPPIVTTYVVGTAASGGNIFNASGSPPVPGVALSTTQGYGGVGGPSAYGSGGGQGTGALAGAGATGYGAGGGGCFATNGGAALTSGPGTQGIVIIEEFGTI